jgi:hypothetical protein
LPRALMADLLGSADPGAMTSEAQAVSERFDPEAARIFELACAHAHRKIKQGKLTSLALPLAYDWMSMAIQMGAKPSFFRAHAKPGMIASACSFMDHAYTLGIHDGLSESECSFVEADELALATLGSADRAPKKAARL